MKPARLGPQKVPQKILQSSSSNDLAREQIKSQ